LIRNKRPTGSSLAPMVDPFPGVPYSFGALRKTFGPLWVRCDVCRRYARLFLRELRDVDYRTKTFSCSIVAPTARSRSRSPAKTPGLEDYRLDQRVDSKHHPAAVKRVTEPKRRSYRHVSGELLGRKTDSRARRALTA
jgi:hypothetical protein